MSKKCPFFREQCDDTCAVYDEVNKIPCLKQLTAELIKLNEKLESGIGGSDIE